MFVHTCMCVYVGSRWGFTLPEVGNYCVQLTVGYAVPENATATLAMLDKHVSVCVYVCFDCVNVDPSVYETVSVCMHVCVCVCRCLCVSLCECVREGVC